MVPKSSLQHSATCTLLYLSSPSPNIMSSWPNEAGRAAVLCTPWQYSRPLPLTLSLCAHPPFAPVPDLTVTISVIAISPTIMAPLYPLQHYPNSVTRGGQPHSLPHSSASTHHSGHKTPSIFARQAMATCLLVLLSAILTPWFKVL